MDVSDSSSSGTLWSWEALGLGLRGLDLGDLVGELVELALDLVARFGVGRPDVPKLLAQAARRLHSSRRPS